MILDMDLCELSDGGIVVHLTKQQCKFVEILASSSHIPTVRRIVIYDEMIKKMWPEDEPDWAYKILQVQAHNIRKKVKAAGLPLVVKTWWGSGYIAACDIEMVNNNLTMTILMTVAKEARRLLSEHHDHAAADRVLAAFVCA